MKVFFSTLVLMFTLSSLIAQDIPKNFKNPIIPGFHPDPSICRVGNDYYLVNSSFEWTPGIPIYHSKDLVNWQLIGYGLTRPNQVPIAKGVNDSGGIYAVTIRYNNGLFYLITTCVGCNENFYITSTSPNGPWSDPIWLNSTGIDPSLFWDDDGKCYYIGQSNITDINNWPDKCGAWLQELDLKNGKLIGSRTQLTHGHATNARWTEGPHIYKIDGKYLLLVAEGGTGDHHAVTVFHSDKVDGNYIPYHSNPVLTHRSLGSNFPIQAVGHADLVQTQYGDWWSVMLGKRTSNRTTLLARETFLTPVSFQNEEGYPLPIFNPGEGKLLESQQRPNLPWSPINKIKTKDQFTNDTLALEWNFLRTPMSKWYAIEKGQLLLKLRPEVIDSLENPSFIAKRVEAYNYKASTSIQFKTSKANEQAGLVIYRLSKNHIQLLKTKNCLVLSSTYNGATTELARIEYRSEKVVLSVEAKNLTAQFSYGENQDNLKPIGVAVDLTILSDEKSGGFNGPFVGMYATSNGLLSKSVAAFDWFEYSE